MSVKMYIEAVGLFNLIANEDMNLDVYNRSLDLVATAFKELDEDSKNLIRLSCNAEIHDAIWCK